MGAAQRDPSTPMLAPTRAAARKRIVREVNGSGWAWGMLHTRTNREKGVNPLPSRERLNTSAT